MKPEFKKTLEGRSSGQQCSFTIKGAKNPSADGHEEAVQNADGSFIQQLTFNKVGTYKYKITEKAGSLTVDYDALNHYDR